MIYTSIRQPRWANPEKTKINCFVKFSDFKIEVEFTADPNDVEAHGRDIFNRCLSGEFGTVGDYIPYSEPTVTEATGSQIIPLPTVWPEILDFLNQANAENSRGTPRGIILVWASMIEQLLGRLLDSHVVDDTIAHDLIWNDSHSSLGTFSGRSKCCFALGLISRGDLKVCDKIRAIRNIAAHEWNLDLSNATIVKKLLPAVRALYDADHSKLYEWKQDDLIFMIVHFYSSSCAMLAIRLANRAQEVANERRREWKP